VSVKLLLRWLAVAGIFLVGGGLAIRTAYNATVPISRTATDSSREPLAEVLEATKGLGVTQQQAVDQLQVVQEQLIIQKEETRKLATEKMDALQAALAILLKTPAKK
jgi:hypothetical protein